MTLTRFLRLTAVTIIVVTILIALGFDYSTFSILIFLVLMNLYYWLDHKLFI